MNLVYPQVSIDGYVSDTGNLCLEFDINDIIEIDNMGILIIHRENAENFVIGLSVLLEEIQNGMV